MKNTLPQITIHGRANIFAVKAGITLQIMREQSFELHEPAMRALKGVHKREEFAYLLKIFFLDQVKNQFVSMIRADHELRNRVGGTKWAAKMVGDENDLRIHLGGRNEMINHCQKIVDITLQGKSPEHTINVALDDAMGAVVAYLK